MQKTTHVVPIIGGRKVEHLLANLEALDISLSKEQVEYIEGILPFERGFPYTVIVGVKLQLKCMYSRDCRETKRHIRRS